MKTRLIASLGVLAVLLLTAGCGSARRSLPIMGPIDLTEEQQRGRLVFMQHCHVCHPGGESGVGPALNNKPLPAALIKFQTRVGLGVMPGFGEEMIGEDELDSLASYLVQLRRAD